MGDDSQKPTGYQPWWAIDKVAWRERFAVFYKLKGISNGRTKPLPPWTSNDVEEFVKLDAVYGPRFMAGERTILETSSTSIISNFLIGLGNSKTYMMRTLLPKVLPPSYKGTAVQYVYYITVSIRWTYTIVENGHGPSPQQHMAPVLRGSSSPTLTQQSQIANSHSQYTMATNFEWWTAIRTLPKALPRLKYQ